MANSGADKPATHTITQEWANSHSITRLWAEYDTIARHANEQRYAALVANSGLTATEANCVRGSDAWGPLMAVFRDVESRGLDLDRGFPALVQGRTVAGADDIAAVLHGRVTKWLETAGEQRQPDRIVGLFPAARQVTDQDVEQALQERRALIEANARTQVLEALRRRDPWIGSLGGPPADPVHREEWLRGLDTIAAYRDRWQVRGNASLGAEPRTREQMAQRLAGQRALTAAQDAARTVNSSGNVPTEGQGLEPRIP